MVEVNKSELAAQLGVKPSMVSKHVKSGVLDGCYTPNGKKLYLEKAIQAIALSRKKGSEESDTDTNTLDDIPEQIYTAESQGELSKLLLLAKSPSQKVQITKDFWVGKINRQKFLEAEGELISIKDAKVALETLIGPLNQYLNDQGNNLKNNFPNVSAEVMEWIDEENNRQKEQLRVTQWD